MICRGQYSIQLEINNIARSNRHWGKLIRDMKWREQTRKQLLDSTESWCDYKNNLCVCESDYVSYTALFNRNWEG